MINKNLNIDAYYSICPEVDLDEHFMVVGWHKSH